MRRIAFELAAVLLAASAAAQPPRPGGQIVPGPTGTTGTLFWDQKADTLATAQQYTYAYYIDANAAAIVMSASCRDQGIAGVYACNGSMSTLAAGSHDYTLEVRCAFCTPSAVKAVPLTYNNAGSNGLVAPGGLRVESSSGSNIPPLAAIVDSTGATWTQSATPPTACPPSVPPSHPPGDCLSQMRNGTVVGLGKEIYYSNGSVYVSGPSGDVIHWWRYNGVNDWTDVGATKPAAR